MKISSNCPVCRSKNITKDSALLMPFIAKKVFGWEPLTIKKKYNFKTLKLGTSYSACNSVFCENCTLLFLDIRFDANEMKRLYKNYRDKNYTILREKYEPGYSDRNNMLSKKIHYMPSIEKFIIDNTENNFSNLLDWGGETGINTPFLNSPKIEKFIYDISGNKKDNKEIKYLKNINYKKFDLITCLHVFEHIPYPLKELKKLALNLKKNSCIYIEVPHESIINDGHLDKNILNVKKHWHEHVNFFSRESLENLIHQAGLKLLKIDKKNVTKGKFVLSIYQLVAMK